MDEKNDIHDDELRKFEADGGGYGETPIPTKGACFFADEHCRQTFAVIESSIEHRSDSRPTAY
jgi:hypothetical protein